MSIIDEDWFRGRERLLPVELPSDTSSLTDTQPLLRFMVDGVASPRYEFLSRVV